MTDVKTKSALSPQGKPYDELSHFINADGNHIFTKCWEPSADVETRALVLIAHGISEHCGRYDPLAEVLVAKGIRTFAHDHLGHGQSEGARIDVTDFNIFVRDVLQHAGMIKEKHSGLPLFLIGHSMGGTIAILSMNKKPTEFAGCVLIAAATQINPAEATPFRLFLAKASAYMMPQVGIVAIEPKWISRYPEEVEDYANDPLNYHGKVKARISVQVLKGIDNVFKSIDSIEWPVLILHGDKDHLVLLEGSKVMHERIKSKDKTLKIYPEHFHALHREIPEDAEKVRKDILNWIEERIDRKPEVAGEEETNEVTTEKKESEKEKKVEETKEENEKAELKEEMKEIKEDESVKDEELENENKE
ncbi:monoglyceride lipase-like [Antedon mediterranea]|uniref:monoglyceride lipase-like n=1 Tax=Antedon mediterranea TaxID=105859 RepID=UPI003AF62693